jgi:asparagine synthase (glutamine-hydrolysing)
MDSNILLGLARSAAPEQALDTYTNLADDFRRDEGLIGAAERMNALFDQPFGNTAAIAAEQLAQIAARRHKVCIVGDGCDELTAGHTRYRALMIHEGASLVAAPLRLAVRGATVLLGEHGRMATSLRRARMFASRVGRPMEERFLDWSTHATETDATFALGRGSGPTAFSHAMRDLYQRNASDPLRAAALVDFRSFVPFNLMQSADRTAMAHSLELRSPYLSTRLVELSLRFPHGLKRRGSRARPLFQDAFKNDLPPSITRQRKQPSNPPMSTHVRAQLDSIETCLLGRDANVRGLVSSDYLRRELAAFRSGHKENSTLLYGLVALERWLARPASVGSAPVAAAPAAALPVRDVVVAAR